MNTPKHPFTTQPSTTPRDTDKPPPAPAATNPGSVRDRWDLARTASRGDIPGAQIVRSIERGIE